MSASTIVVMGVSGVGKTTIARLLAERIDAPFAEGDDFHSAANVAKMSAGTPLEDADRWPWLAAIGGWLRERQTAGTGGVVTCSALRRAYRDVLRAAAPGVFFVHLDGSEELVAERMGERSGHFMPQKLLRSQFATLEPLESDEDGTVVDVGGTPEELADVAAARIRAR
jgi:gluconokinase